MTSKASTKNKAQSAADPDAEHEALLLAAAELLPVVIAEELQDLDPVHEATGRLLEETDWVTRVEDAVRNGKLVNSAQIALWREAVREVPSFQPLPSAKVVFGYSLFQRKSPSTDRDVKRLGMVDLCVDWECPADRFNICCHSDFSGTIPVLTSAHDAYSLRRHPMRLFAVAFHSGLRLGRVLEQIEGTSDNIRKAAESRYARIAPLVVITGRPEVYDAVMTRHDALLIEDLSYSYHLDRVIKAASERHGDRTFDGLRF